MFILYDDTKRCFCDANICIMIIIMRVFLIFFDSSLNLPRMLPGATPSARGKKSREEMV